MGGGGEEVGEGSKCSWYMRVENNIKFETNSSNRWILRQPDQH